MYVLMLDEDKSALNITILKRQNKVFKFFLILFDNSKVASSGGLRSLSSFTYGLTAYVDLIIWAPLDLIPTLS